MKRRVIQSPKVPPTNATVEEIEAAVRNVVEREKAKEARKRLKRAG